MDFDKYKKGNLSEQDLDQLTGRLLRAKFRQEQKEKWTKKLVSEYNIQRSTSKKDKRFTIPFRKIAIAASILLLIGLIPFLQDFFQPEYQQLADSYIEVYLPISGIARGSIASANSSLRVKAYNSYENGDFKQSAKYFEQIISSKNNIIPEDYLYLGLSYLNKEDLAKAIENLEMAQSKIRDSNQLEAAEWFTTLAYIKNSNLILAEKKLSEIAMRQNYYGERANLLLQSLQRNLSR